MRSSNTSPRHSQPSRRMSHSVASKPSTSRALAVAISHLTPRLRSELQILLNLSYNLANLKGPALHFRKGHCVNQELRAYHRAKLAQVHLGYDHSLES